MEESRDDLKSRSAGRRSRMLPDATRGTVNPANLFQAVVQTPLKQLIIVLASLGCMATNALAQDYPERTVKIVIPYVPGGGIDAIARLVAKQLAAVLGQPFIVENKGGAGGTVGTAQVTESPADGYTLLFSDSGQLAIAPHLYKSLPYDAMRDLRPVGRVVNSEGGFAIIASARTSLRTIHDLIREAKANPGKFNYGSSGVGSPHQLAMEIFTADVGIKLTHIPYKGQGQAMPALLSGELSVLITSFAQAQPHVQSGAARLLAVTAPTRFAGAPDIPALSEIVPGYDFVAGMAILAPARVPPPVLSKLSKALKTALESPELVTGLRARGMIPAWTTPEEYGDIMREDQKKYGRAIKLLKILPE